MEQVRPRRLHIVHATDWKAAVITLLEPRSPYRPWRHGSAEARSGDTVAFVLDTDPPSILTERIELTTDGGLDSAVFDEPLRHATLKDSADVAVFPGLDVSIADRWWFDGEEADTLELVLDDYHYTATPATRFGHTSLAAARTLLRFWGGCDGCEQPIDLTGPDARDEVFVHTIDLDGRQIPAGRWALPADWPAVMCRSCRDRMADEGHSSFVDFNFTLHPPCPACGAHRTQETFYGMPMDHQNIEPWSNAGGCCVSLEKWSCSECDHQW